MYELSGFRNKNSKQRGDYHRQTEEDAATLLSPNCRQLEQPPRPLSPSTSRKLRWKLKSPSIHKVRASSGDCEGRSRSTEFRSDLQQQQQQQRRTLPSPKPVLRWLEKNTPPTMEPSCIVTSSSSSSSAATRLEEEMFGGGVSLFGSIANDIYDHQARSSNMDDFFIVGKLREDDEELEAEGESRDDVGLLNGSTAQNMRASTRHSESREMPDEDRISLLSEHDDLVESRLGSYNVDEVDPSYVEGVDALHDLPMWFFALEAPKGPSHAEVSFCPDFSHLGDVVQTIEHHRQSTCKQAIDKGLSDTEHVSHVSVGTSCDEETCPDMLSGPVVGFEVTSLDGSGGCEVDDKGAPIWSEDLRERLEKQKAYQRRVEKSRRRLQQPSIYAGARVQIQPVSSLLWTLSERSSEDDRTTGSGSVCDAEIQQNLLETMADSDEDPVET